jgi:hypothetical protein
MSEEINQNRRRFLANAVMTIAAAQAPVITVPTITLEGGANGAPHPDASAYANDRRAAKGTPPGLAFRA